MFERYTEQARRVLFFSRYEASQVGSVSIGTEHVLLGLTREAHGIVAKVLAMSNTSADDLRREIERRTSFCEKVSTSVEMPFNDETKRALMSAAEEAEGLSHSYIGSEHLLLGLLRHERSIAGAILSARGLRVDDVRNQIVKFVAEGPASPHALRAEISLQIDRIRELVAQLASLPPGSSEAPALAARIRDGLDALKHQIVE